MADNLGETADVLAENAVAQRLQFEELLALLVRKGLLTREEVEEAYERARRRGEELRTKGRLG